MIGVGGGRIKEARVAFVREWRCEGEGVVDGAREAAKEPQGKEQKKTQRCPPKTRKRVTDRCVVGSAADSRNGRYPLCPRC